MSRTPLQPHQLVWPGLVQASFACLAWALMTCPCPTLSGTGEALCRYVQGLNSKQCLLTVNTSGGGGPPLPGPAHEHKPLSGPYPSIMCEQSLVVGEMPVLPLPP